MLGIHALSASLSLLLETGMAVIEARVIEKTNMITVAIENNSQLTLLSARQERLKSGIVTFKHKTISNETLYAYLQQNGVVCALRGGGIRFSPHFYNTAEEITRALDCCSDLKS
jgi:selenocysteine lyase/cysteine desulfurase